MSLTTTESLYSYPGDGSTVAFAFPRAAQSASDIKARVVSAAGVISVPSYTVSGSGSSWTVTFAAAPAASSTVEVYRDPDLVQQTDFTASGAPLDAVNSAMDRVYMALQRLDYRMDQSSAVWDENASALQVVATGSVSGRTLADRFADTVNLLDWGVVVNDESAASANTAAFNAALAYAYDADKAIALPAGIVYVQETGSSGYCLLNEGVPMRGVGRNGSIIAPVSTLSSSASIMRITPPSGEYIDFLPLEDFLIYMNISGSPKGKHGIHLYTPNATNLSAFRMRGVYITAGNDYSLRMENGVVNTQGVPANAIIENCYFAEGVNATYHGDNLSFVRNIFRSTGTRCGIRVYAVDLSGGVAGNLSVVGNNADCAGGFITVIRGRHIHIENNNVEQSSGAGSNGAVIDIDGSSGTIQGKNIIRGNHIGIFGTATVTSALRIHGTDDCVVATNDLESSISVASGIVVTSSASGVVLDSNTISGFTASVSDSGTGTLRQSTVPITTSDNGVPRFDSTAGALQTSNISIDDNGAVLQGAATIVDAAAGVRLPSYTAANIASAAHAVNTANKAAGKMIWDTTNNRVMVANGSNATSPWYVADASASVTPS